MSSVNLPKDADRTIAVRVANLNIAGATIVWQIVGPDADWAGDLDALDALVTKTVGAGIAITAAATGAFTVTMDAEDTELADPDTRWWRALGIVDNAGGIHRYARVPLNLTI